MFKKIKKTWLIIILPIVLIVSWSYVDNDFKIAKNLDIFFTLFKELNIMYVDETNPEKLIQTGIDAMLESLDPYTTFIPESEADDFKFQTTGQYGGIGSLIKKQGEYAIISEPYEGFPAQKAGLKAGDIIYSVNGTSAKGKDISTISEMLKGTPGTEVSVEVKRPGVAENLNFKFVRQKILIPNVSYYGLLSDSIGYIRLTSFTTDAGKEVRNALIELKKQKAKSIILDLRNNPGGLLNEAVNVSNVFIDKNQEIVSTKGRIKQFDNTYKTSSQATDTELPLAVLISRGSASASEIVAGSIQDLDRGILIGQRSFGKGLVQSTRPLSYNTQLKVTTAKYYIPSGRCIQALDYTHKNEDGSVGHIPDSLISEFKTKNGRKVYDGGGVEPDVKVELEQLSSIAYSLLSKSLIFDYATEFVMKHDSISSPSTFTITDNEYESFIKFLEPKEYDYKTRSEENLNKLIDIVKKEKYYSLAENDLNSLKSKLAHDKVKDLNTFRKEIEVLLKEEIVCRYYYQKGKIQTTLIDDPEVKKAVEALKNKQLYSDIIKGTKGELASRKEKLKNSKNDNE